MQGVHIECVIYLTETTSITASPITVAATTAASPITAAANTTVIGKVVVLATAVIGKADVIKAIVIGEAIVLDKHLVHKHKAGSYPGTGKIDQIGCGSGEGSTLNLPLPGVTGDTAMRTVFDEVIVPCAQRFKPDIILVSAGYDAHQLDPLASLQFTTGTYYMLASSIKQLAKDLCGGRCVFFLEG
ncbi:hypothetical protein KY284_020215 [Solanum tuberosum]|nr:hypothetical protein KY284_020215 [Solanum tuberosum]